MGSASDWAIDRPLYGRHGWLLQPAYWAVAIYRFGRWTLTAPKLLRPISHAVYLVAYLGVRLQTGIDIPRSAKFGPGLMIHHFGGIIIHPGSVVGSRCVMRHGVTIGAKEGTGAPTLGDDVRLGAYAQILGDVRIGSGASVGAMSVVLSDVSAGETVVGIPARPVKRDL